jgi:hypothetical protein
MIIGAEIHGLEAAMAEIRFQPGLSVLLSGTYFTLSRESSATVTNGENSYRPPAGEENRSRTRIDADGMGKDRVIGRKMRAES